MNAAQIEMFDTSAAVAPKTEKIRHNRLDVVAIQLVKERKVDYNAERFTQPRQAADAFRAMLGHVDREYFVILMLDGKNRITSIHRVSEGSLNQSIVHPREVYKAAVLANAASIICCHNHPTGDPTPSREDLEITKRIKEAGDIMGIRVLDHVIIDTESDRYYSFSENGNI